MITAHFILPGSFNYEKQTRRQKAASSNKTNPNAQKSQLNEVWIKIQQKKDSDVVLDSIDLCTLIKKIFSTNNNIDERQHFFNFLARCPNAANYVASLLLNSHCTIPTHMAYQSDDSLQPAIPAAKTMLDRLISADYSATKKLFSALFSGGQTSRALQDLAATTPGGAAVLMQSHPKMLQSISIETLLNFAVTNIVPGSNEEKGARSTFSTAKELENYNRLLFVYLLNHRKTEFQQHPVFNALFPLQSPTDEEASPDKRGMVTPMVSSAVPSPARSDLLESPQLGAIAEGAEPQNPLVSSDLLSSPGLMSPQSSRLSSPHLAVPNDSVPAVLNFDDAAAVPITPQRAPVVVSSLTAVQNEGVKGFKKYLLSGESSLNILFHFHPDIFYNFVLHAKEDELLKLLAAFPDPLDYFETTRNKYTHIIKQRFDVIAKFLGNFTKGKESLSKRLTKFFTNSKSDFGNALKKSLKDLTESWSEHTGNAKAKIVTMVTNPLVRDHLKLHENLDLLDGLIRSINIDTAQRGQSNNVVVNASYAAHYHLVKDQNVWKAMKRNNWSYFGRTIPGAQSVLEPENGLNPQPQATSSRPAHNFYLARYQLEKLGLISIIGAALAKPDPKIDTEIAYLIAGDPKLAKAFSKLGPKAPWWKKVAKRPEASWTQAQIENLNPILKQVWHEEVVTPPEYVPPAQQQSMAMNALADPNANGRALSPSVPLQAVHQSPVHLAPVHLTPSKAEVAAPQPPAAASNNNISDLNASLPRIEDAVSAQDAAQNNNVPPSPASTLSSPRLAVTG